jgi:TonB family protein
MRAADAVQNSGDADVVRIDRPADRQHPTPAYAKRANDLPVAGTPSLGVDLRGQLAQLAQWLIVFGALGLLVGGAKWLNARQAVQPFPPVASSAATGTAARGDEPTASGTPTRGLLAPTVRAPAEVPYPRRIHDVEPLVPSSGAARRGIAILALLIDTVGNVAEVETLRGVDPELDAAAIGAARLWKFDPTMHEGRPVAVRGNFSVTFGYE